MPQIFHPSTNTIAKVSIFGAVFILGAAWWIIDMILRGSWATGVEEALVQPIPFSHKHHVGGVGIDCRYCHSSVEKSAFAGFPATQVCIGCHSQIWKDAPVLAPVRDSFRDDASISWTRVHKVADFVYFNHSIHVAKGVGCVSCHGRVDEMPITWKEHSLHMQWCLECHRHPEDYLRPKEQVFSMDWKPSDMDPPEDQATLGRRLKTEYHIGQTKPLPTTPHEFDALLNDTNNNSKSLHEQPNSITTCSTCHR